jgi:hypothetical protein
MGYVVEQLAPSSATRDYLISLWQRNLHMRGEPRDKFSWFYENNPAGAATAFVLKSAPDAAGRPDVVGCCGLGSREMMVGGERLIAGLMADFAVDQQHRTVMPALMLQRALCGEALSRYRFAYAFPNSSAVGIFSRIGFQPLGRMQRFVKVLRSSQYLRDRVPGMVAAVGGPVVDWTIRGGETARRLSSNTRKFSLEWVDDVDVRFDRFWERVQREHAFIGVRDAAFLRWRFTSRPGQPGAIAALTATDGEIHGYAAIMQKQPGVAFLADFLASTDTALAALLNHLVPALREKPYHAVTTVFMGPRRIQRVLSSAGFHPRGEGKHVVLGRSAEAADNRCLPSEAEQAYLTEADRDN